jgi:CheY-like chemotaxis protein
MKASDWNESAAGAPKGLVMVVEDNFNLREMLTIILQRSGYRVIPAADGRDALHQFSLNAADVALVACDLHLPSLGGVEVFEQIKATGHTPKFLIVTGLIVQRDLARFAAAGITDYITKPFPIPDFLKKIEEMLQPLTAAAD